MVGKAGLRPRTWSARVPFVAPQREARGVGRALKDERPPAWRHGARHRVCARSGQEARAASGKSR